ncbi:hypothetical protein [Herpetosiphon sp. NSE202]|uniref:hypothetical protein n=1 Tax=Herpetosiphon sp. NSE202 TaxID=3351349 RepID=UPI0036403557
MQIKETRILAVVAGGLNWIISLMAAFGAEDSWFQAGQFFFLGGFFVLLGLQVSYEGSALYKKLAWASLAISMIFAVLHLMN